MIKLKNLIKDAKFLRESTNTTQLEKTANKLAKTLAIGNIPHFIAGGYSVQEYGYPRTTTDVDIIVPNITDAIDYLSIRGFSEVKGNKMKVVDRDNKVEVDLLPGNKSVDPNAKVMLPMPTEITNKPNLIKFTDLISIKLDSYMTAGIRRIKDYTDVVELIIRQRLPLDLYKDLNENVKKFYIKTWTKINSKKI